MRHFARLPCGTIRLRRRSHVGEDAQAAARLTEDSDISRVASECANVPLHPVKRELLIQNAVISRSVVRRFCSQRRMRQKSQCAQAVIDRDNDHAPYVYEPASIEIITFASCQSTAMDPNHDGAKCRFVSFVTPAIIATLAIRNINIQEQAIFAYARCANYLGSLRAMAAKFRSIENPGPVRGRLGRLPPQISHRRSSIRNA
jgi:hypothetical protein